MDKIGVTDVHAKREKTMTINKSFCCLGVLLFACVANLRADITLTPGNNPQPDETNILLNSGATGTTVTGTPSGFADFTVIFSSTQELAEPSSGQARVSANPEGTPLTNLIISLASGTYGDLILNPFIGPCTAYTLGTATVTVNSVDQFGVPEAPSTFSYDLGNGNNFLTIFASNGEQIVSTEISTPGGINDLRQPRISGLTGVVPEPSSVALLFGVVASFVAARRKFRKA